ncbi:PP2C, putative [Toxoplasma gondii ME49]|uniref:PP2C, putative n=2 Tax=Toxoplasma gondii TaxID=5811 RepID=S8GJ93_TOXGM|nr:PP2C, putative [Toxoplasma gondii ME49]EPT28569.1 PP2C, putative [Toxoplasma gondii ME49]|eukprot:XP_018636689.1 PP2C, putative [Toxoplasma gondii ME49]
MNGSQSQITQSQSTTAPAGSSGGSVRTDAKVVASHECTESCSRGSKMDERKNGNARAERVAGSMGNPDEGKRCDSPLEGRVSSSTEGSGKGVTSEELVEENMLKDSQESEEEVKLADKSEERPNVLETWPGSPQRRRRLSLSRSAEAREDKLEKARGQAIIAVGSEVPEDLLLAQRLTSTRPPSEKTETNAESERERPSSLTLQPERECEETTKASERRETETDVEEESESPAQETKSDTADGVRGKAGEDTVPAKKTESAQEVPSSEGDSRERLQSSASLQDPQRRRLSVSRSPTVSSPERAGTEETERGHTALTVEGIGRRRGSEERETPERGDKEEGKEQVKRETAGGTRSSSPQKQRGKSTTRRLSVAGLSSERTQSNFEDKKVEKHGQAAQQDSLNQFGIGMCCKKGFKPESPNQDDFFIIRVDKWSLYGVFDGHGPFGHDVSNYVQKELPARLLYGEPRFLTFPLRALQTSFTTIHRELEDQTDDAMSGAGGIDCSMSGTTATVVLHIHALKKLFVAHVGDSRAVIARREHASSRAVAGGSDGFRQETRNDSRMLQQQTSSEPRETAEDRGCRSAGTGTDCRPLSRLMAFDLTNDHKPTNEIEKQRIMKAGGQVRRLEGDVPHRVFLKNRLFPGLAMSRAIGDTIATQAGVIPDPEVREYEILEGRDEFLLICSDGVWEFISSQEAVDMVSTFGRDNVQKACDAIAREAWKRWIDEEHNVVDDITVLVIYFP